MQLKKSFPFLMHGAGCAIIATLLSLIFQKQQSDCDTPLQTEAWASFEAAHTSLDRSNQKILNQIILSVEDYPKPSSVIILNHAKTLAATLDSLEIQLDSLQNYPQDDEMLYRVEGQLQMYRSAVETALAGNPKVGALIPAFTPADWLFQAHKNNTGTRFRTIIAEAKLKILAMEYLLFYYYFGEVATYAICIFDPSSPYIRVQQLSPSVGDTIVTEVSHSGNYDQLHLSSFTLNGQQLPVSEGSGKFNLRFDQPGIYPLRAAAHVLNVLTDSTTISESTYWLRVRE